MKTRDFCFWGILIFYNNFYHIVFFKKKIILAEILYIDSAYKLNSFNIPSISMLRVFLFYLKYVMKISGKKKNLYFSRWRIFHFDKMRNSG